MLALKVLTLLQVAGACPVDESALRGDAAAAQSAYMVFDWGSFDQAVASMRLHLGCVEGPVQPETAAGVHLTQALFAWRARDELQVDAALRGLRHADPAYTLPVEIAPPGHPLAARFAVAAAAGAALELPPGRWTVDGQSGDLTLRADRAALVQRQGLGGAVETWYWWGGALLPEWTSPPPRQDLVLPPDPQRAGLAPEDRVRLAAVGSLGALAVTGLGLGLWAAHQTSAEPVSLERYQRLRGLHHTALVASPVLGAAAVGLAVTWQW